MFKIYVFEKSVIFEILGTVFQVSIALRKVTAQQVLNKRLAFTVEAIGVSWLGVDNFPVNIHGVVVLEWRITCKHFVKQDAHGPPVHCFSMTLI